MSATNTSTGPRRLTMERALLLAEEPEFWLCRECSKFIFAASACGCGATIDRTFNELMEEQSMGAEKVSGTSWPEPDVFGTIEFPDGSRVVPIHSKGVWLAYPPGDEPSPLSRGRGAWRQFPGPGLAVEALAALGLGPGASTPAPAGLEFGPEDKGWPGPAAERKLAEDFEPAADGRPEAPIPGINELRAHQLEIAKVILGARRGESIASAARRVMARVAELEDELVDGNPDLPLVDRIAANQDERAGKDATAPKPPLTVDERCLHHSLTDLSPIADKEWWKYPDAMTDAEVWAVVRAVWPAADTFVPPKGERPAKGYSLMGGPEPRFWLGGRHDWTTKPTWEGPTLLAKIRDVMDLLWREPTDDEKLDAALLYVLTREPYGQDDIRAELRDRGTEELLDHLSLLWPSSPAHLNFADEPAGEGFTVCGGDIPELYLGSPGRNIAGEDAPGYLSGDRLSARVRKVLGLPEAPDRQAVEALADAFVEHFKDVPDPTPSPPAMRPWNGGDLANAMDDLVERTGLAAWNRREHAGRPPLDSEIVGVARDALGNPGIGPRYVTAKECGGFFGYAFMGGTQPRFWMDPLDGADFKGGSVCTLADAEMVAEIRKALDRDFPRPKAAKSPRKSRAKPKAVAP